MVHIVPIYADVLTEGKQKIGIVIARENLEVLAPPLFPVEIAANVPRLLPFDLLQEVWIIVEESWQKIDLTSVLQRSRNDEPGSAVGWIWSKHGPVLRETEEATECARVLCNRYRR